VRQKCTSRVQHSHGERSIDATVNKPYRPNGFTWLSYINQLTDELPAPVVELIVPLVGHVRSVKYEMSQLSAFSLTENLLCWIGQQSMVANSMADQRDYKFHIQIPYPNTTTTQLMSGAEGAMPFLG
jgi:hypothetical protein